MIFDENFKISKNDQSELIKSVDDWLRLCPPAKKEKQWKDERSAKELAKFWMNKEIYDKEFSELLKKFSDLSLKNAYPEFKTAFDSYKSPRVNDLLIEGTQGTEKIIIGVEAKADETFGDTLKDAITDSFLTKLSKPESNAINRIEGLVKALFNNYTGKILDLRYQLLYSIAGLLSYAREKNVSKVIFIVHTFKSSSINENKYKQNSNDLNAFIKLLGNSNFTEVNSHQIIGPIRVVGNEKISPDIDLYIGKIETNLQNNLD